MSFLRRQGLAADRAELRAVQWNRCESTTAERPESRVRKGVTTIGTGSRVAEKKRKEECAPQRSRWVGGKVNPTRAVGFIIETAPGVKAYPLVITISRGTVETYRMSGVAGTKSANEWNVTLGDAKLGVEARRVAAGKRLNALRAKKGLKTKRVQAAAGACRTEGVAG